MHGGHHLAGNQAVFRGELIDNSKRLRYPFRGVDNNRHGGDMSAELKGTVAVWLVVAGKSPYAAQRRRPTAASGALHP